MKTAATVELKYCERCGGLWLRETGNAQVYCVRCLPVLDDWPSPPRRSFPKLPVAAPVTLDDIDFEIHDLDDHECDDGNDLDGMAWFAPGGAA